MNKILTLSTIVGGLLLLAVLVFGLSQCWFSIGGNCLASSVMSDTENIDQVVFEEEGFSVGGVNETDGLKHSVPLGEIVGGGPPKDGIPSIDDPKFISADEAADFLSDDEMGIAVMVGDESRFYPFLILVWHEVVNDVFVDENGQEQNVLVTYCPLCLSGIVFNPVVNGKPIEFGTSGKLWNSNLVMYDRETGSYWSQVLGEAIVGELTGEKLEVFQSDQLRFGAFRQRYPTGKVLSKDTGAVRFYGVDPYADYYTSDEFIFPLNERDERLEPKEVVLGVVVDGKAKAYWPPAIQEQGEFVDNFNGKKLVLRYDDELDVVRMYEQSNSGELIRFNPMTTFWLPWLAAHPETDLLK